MSKIGGLIKDDLAQGKSNEEIQVDIARLFGDDGSDGVNPLHDITLSVKRAAKTASSKALEDAAAEVNNAVQCVAQDAAQPAVQEAVREAIQEAAPEVGQEAAQELAQEAGGSLALQTVEQLVQYVVVRNSVEKIEMAAMDPAAYGGEGPDAVVTFMKVMPDIKKAPQIAAAATEATTFFLEKALEDAKDTPRKPFQGSPDDAASKARAAAAAIREAVCKQAAPGLEQAALQVAAKQLDTALRKAVQDATQVIKQEAAERARDAAQDIKEAMRKAVQNVKYAKQEVQNAVQDAAPKIEQTAKDEVQVAASAVAWREERGGATPNIDDVKRAAQDAVPGAVHGVPQSIQTVADAALENAPQELQVGPEVQKLVRKAAQDAVEDAVSKICKAVQDSVADAAEAAMPDGENPRPTPIGMEPDTLS